MKRLTVEARPNWKQRVEKAGLIYHSLGEQPYWDESVCYQFTSAEVNELEAATEELQRLCLVAGQAIIDRDWFDAMHIPPPVRAAIRQAWEAEPPSVYGRFDLYYDGTTPPKLLEYNADTPTALLEASVVQWEWRAEVFPATDQFNSIHEKLVAKWSELKRYLRSPTLHFVSMPTHEDAMTTTYLRDTAVQAGLRTKQLFVRDLGWRASDRTYRDLEDQSIQSIFKLYPWEWMLNDSTETVLSTAGKVDWIEPIWKMMWSNKGLLAILWELFPNHPLLLPAYLDGPRDLTHYVRKPLLSREGANIQMHFDGQTLATPGTYGDGPCVYQQIAPGWRPDLKLPVIGSWYITDQGPAGIGIREAQGIVDNLSRFIPHFF